jgi:hypothetical protein
MSKSNILNPIDITSNDVQIISSDLNERKCNEILKANSKQLKLNFDSTKIFVQNHQQNKLGKHKSLIWDYFTKDLNSKNSMIYNFNKCKVIVKSAVQQI